MSGTYVGIGRRTQLLLRSKSTPLAVLILTVVGLDSLLLASRPGVWLDIVGSGFVILTAASAVILTSGLVAHDFKTGIVQLWLQKPVSPVAFYVARLFDAVLASTVIVVLMVLAVRIAIGALGPEASTDILVLLPRLVLTVVLVSAIGFGLSAWVGRGAAIGTLVLFFAGMLVERDLSVEVGALGAWTPIVRSLLFPESALGQITDFMSGEANVLWLPLLRVGLYASAWTGVGVLGVVRAVHRSGLARAQGS